MEKPKSIIIAKYCFIAWFVLGIIRMFLVKHSSAKLVEKNYHISLNVATAYEYIGIGIAIVILLILLLCLLKNSKIGLIIVWILVIIATIKITFTPHHVGGGINNGLGVISIIILFIGTVYFFKKSSREWVLQKKLAKLQKEVSSIKDK